MRNAPYNTPIYKTSPPRFEVFKGESKDKRVWLLILRGDLYVLLKQYPEAIADYELSISIYERSGRKEKVMEKIAAARQKMTETNQPK